MIKNRLAPVIQVVLGTVILALLGPMAINMTGYTPITLQSLGVIIVPIAFGWRLGGISIVLYLLAGGFGLPVFADFRNGWEVFTGPTAGFLFGFLPAGILAGWWVEKMKVQFARYFILFLAAHALILLFGLIGMALYGLSGLELWNTTKYLLPGAFIKSFIGGILVLALRMKGDRTRQ
jgi:biotin transport system substrate-specific component